MVQFTGAISGPILSAVLFGFLVYILFVIGRCLVLFVRMTKFFNNLPGYKPEQKHWLRGDLPLYAKNDSINIDEVLSLTEKFPKFYRVWFGSFKPNIVLVHPDSIKILLKTAEPKPVGFGGAYRPVLPWIGDGLLLSSGQKWARSRRLLTPAFHFEILKPYQSIYNQCADTLLGIVDKYAESGESFELFQLISNCTLDIILQCAFSYKTNCQKDRLQHPYCSAITEVATIVGRRNRNPLMVFDFLFNNSKDGEVFKEKCDYIHHIANTVIESRKEALKSGTVEQKKYLDFLDILLSAKDESGEGMSKTDIRAEVDTFMFEGHDTTTSGIAWILYELAKNQHYQTKCQEEIDEVMKNGKGFVTCNIPAAPAYGVYISQLIRENLSKFEFLTQCIKEGMRYHPPVPATSRKSTREFTIGGTTFPAGTSFGLNIYAVHHNPIVWKDHMTYDPSRFSKDNDTKMDSFAFLPFAAGPRNCIGQHFALNEEKTIISRILERFTLELDPNHKVSQQLALVLRSRNGIRCFARRR